ncbi:Acyltransferase 3 domain and Nose resistant-to-fluoxetine protein, N-terminal domain-containing protein [Strongyloides ratti]|uniref:Acyltransferase 3 domain and Nose resistant-to-fluoxetine protein, N-terminal domain-containing protein n=1 Tax=Strongyloides ratti TaxID=34506 RepID=A0A090LNU5_STRRB|nr:Acyltransferase 3 domain and Nose resistant-to-fluoxetine protein, N-terminal domain-containing protein [Strongyloides ratti]CEF71441.1 Acyltransferase 3 domain and Nose resistant-to-fluoxetine protein, N-terminal domain-containing protein [Strongyloides ratti]
MKISLIIFLKLFLLLYISLSIYGTRFEYNNNEWDNDSEDQKIDGNILHNMFHDSNTILSLELDIFKDIIYNFINATESVKNGDDDSIFKILDLLQPIKNLDISPNCVADIFYYGYITTQYARMVNEKKTCNDCNCKANVSKYFDEYEWIFDVVDAMGKVPSAVMSGNNLWIGSWHTCRKIDVIKNQNQKWKGQYCKLQFQPYNRNNPLTQMATSEIPDPTLTCIKEKNLTEPPKWSKWDNECFTMLPLLNFGICVPDTCTEYDIKSILKFFYEKIESLSGSKLICNVNVTCSSEKAENSIIFDRTSMYVIYFLTAIFGTIIFGTFYDIYVHQPSININGQSNIDSIFIHILLAFSIYSNGKYVLAKNKITDQIDCLHGARVLSMMWIILGHTYWYICTSLTADNVLQTLKNFPKIFHNQIIIQAPLAVDSFFLLSGMLTSYLFFKKVMAPKLDNDGNIIMKHSINVKKISFWVIFYLRRYIRLTPVYIVVIILNITVFTHLSNGPFWRPIELNYCRKSWWTNLIYMNNFLLQDVEQCMGWSWYLANDFQLYIISPIYMLLLNYNEKIGIIGCCGTIIISSIYRLIITLIKGYPPGPILTTKLQIVRLIDEFWTNVYVKPYARCGPYMIGIMVGYFLYKYKLKYTMPKWKLYLLWSISTIMGFYSVFGMYPYSSTGEITKFHLIFYTLFGGPMFSLSLGWVIFACSTGNGGLVKKILGWKAFVPLSKLTFCTYLMHPIILQLYNFSRPHPFHFTSTFQMLTLFSVAATASYFVAFFIACAFEFPVTYLDKLIFEKMHPKKADVLIHNEVKNNGILLSKEDRLQTI